MRIIVKINNKAEKLAALYHVANVEKTTITPSTLKSTLQDIMICEYPYIFKDLNRVDAMEQRGLKNTDKIIPFSELEKYEFYKNNKFLEVKLNGNYTAQVYADKVVVGCQEFSIDVVKKLLDAHKNLA